MRSVSGMVLEKGKLALRKIDTFEWPKWRVVHPRVPRPPMLTNPHPDVSKVAGLKFVCNNDVERWLAATVLTKEPGTVAWIQASVRERDVVYDVGANIGCHTLLFAQRVGTAGHVYAFEPHVFSAAHLMANVQLNGLSDRVTAVTAPLHNDEATLLPFNYRSVAPGMSDSQLGHTRSQTGKDFTPALVEIKAATSINRLVLTGAARWPTLVKIDIDGNELRVLEGMTVILQDPRLLRAVQVAVNPDQVGRIEQFFRDHQFTLGHRHYTAWGQKTIDRGADPATVIHNAVYLRARRP